MKRIGILLALICMSAAGTLLAQDKKAQAPSGDKEKQVNPLYELHLRTYVQARKYSDMEVAKDALYRMVVMNPSDSILFELGSLYYNSSQFIQSVLVMNDVLAVNPNFDQALAMKADGLRRIGALDKAAESYEGLYLKTGSVNSLYQLAFIQFDLKRYAEVLTNVDLLLKNPKSKDIKLTFDTAEGKPVKVDMALALTNLKGMVAAAEGKRDEAKKLFQEVLAKEPKFSLAKKELAKLKN